MKSDHASTHRGYECIKCHEIKEGNTEPGMICAECYLLKSYLNFLRGK